MKFFLVDGHRLFLEGLKRIIIDHFPVNQVEFALSYSEYKEKLPKDNWDMIILELNFREKSALQILEEHKQLNINIPTLILSSHERDLISSRLYKEGAFGYLSTQCTEDEFVSAVKTILQGEVFYNEGYNQISKRDSEDLKSLSNREYVVFKKLAEGKAVGQIAEELFLSVKTVSTYRKKILDKLLLDNNAEIIRYAYMIKEID